MNKIILLMVLITTVAVSSVLADVPELINYQGNLTDAGGNPVPDASYSITFTIYDAASLGNIKWTELQAITTTDGAFSVLLGSVNPIKDSVFNATPRYLGIQVNADPEIAPRTNLVTAPYAFYAENGGGWVDTGNRIKLITLSDTVLISDTDLTPQGKVHVNCSVNGTSARLATSLQGVHGRGSVGVYGAGDNYGVRGYSNTGYGGHFQGNGVINALYGGNGHYSTYGYMGHYQGGVFGAREVGGTISYGILAHDSAAVYGRAVYDDEWAVYGKHHLSQNWGVLGDTTYGVFAYAAGPDETAICGLSSEGPFGALGYNNVGVYGYGYLENKSAGLFIGDVDVIGTLSKSSGSFKIDHPLDPANKWLYHSFVESPDMMNVYNGNIITDEDGFSTIEMPEYFDALNKDFRYQLTVIGSFAHAIISNEISDNRFVIQTDKPNIKVSWQVTGIRKDHYAEKNRIKVEVDKSGDEIGKYAHPGLFGYGMEKSVDYENHKRVLRDDITAEESDE